MRSVFTWSGGAFLDMESKTEIVVEIAPSQVIRCRILKSFTRYGGVVQPLSSIIIVIVIITKFAFRVSFPESKSIKLLLKRKKKPPDNIHIFSNVYFHTSPSSSFIPVLALQPNSRCVLPGSPRLILYTSLAILPGLSGYGSCTSSGYLPQNFPGSP